jgi:hypothetical protein
MPDDMKENIKAIRFSPIALPATRCALVCIRASASVDPIPKAGLPRLTLNHFTHPRCLHRGEQNMRLVGTGAHPRASSQRARMPARV